MMPQVLTPQQIQTLDAITNHASHKAIGRNCVTLEHMVTDFFIDEGDCCAGELVKAINEGIRADADEWECPECGCAYRARMIPEASVRYWEPVTEISVLRLRG